MSEYNEGQAIAASQWQASLDASNDRVDTGAYNSCQWYRHEHDRRTEERRPIPEVYVPDLFPPSTGTAVSTYSSSGSSSSSTGEFEGGGTIFAGIVGVIVFLLALPLIGAVLGVFASRVVPWTHAAHEIGRLTGLFGPSGWLTAILFVLALIGLWIASVVALHNAKAALVAIVVVALTLFAATDAVKAILVFAHAPSFNCQATFAWIPQACSADVWTFAKSFMSWSGLASMTGLAAWAVTVVTAMVYLLLGTVLHALLMIPAIVVSDVLD